MEIQSYLSQKGMPKPKKDMKREDRIIHIKGVDLARNIPRGRINGREKSQTTG